jgi:hypothetical protein
MAAGTCAPSVTGCVPAYTATQRTARPYPNWDVVSGKPSAARAHTAYTQQKTGRLRTHLPSQPRGLCSLLAAMESDSQRGALSQRRKGEARPRRSGAPPGRCRKCHRHQRERLRGEARLHVWALGARTTYAYAGLRLLHRAMAHRDSGRQRRSREARSVCRITGFGIHRVAELELDAVAPLVNTVTSCAGGTVHPLPASPSASETVELRSRDVSAVSERQWD